MTRTKKPTRTRVLKVTPVEVEASDTDLDFAEDGEILRWNTKTALAAAQGCVHNTEWSRSQVQLGKSGTGTYVLYVNHPEGKGSLIGKGRTWKAAVDRFFAAYEKWAEEQIPSRR